MSFDLTSPFSPPTPAPAAAAIGVTTFGGNGTTTVTGAFTNENTGRLQVDANATLNVGGPLNNVAGGVIESRGTMRTTSAAGLTNFGTLYADGGAVNGLIYNTGPAGQFDVYGAVTSDSAFSNSLGASLNIAPAGTYAIAAELNNAGVVNSSGVLSAGTVKNTGFIFANGGQVNGPIYNTGPTGEFDVYGAVTSNAAFSNSAGASLNVAPAGTYAIANALNNGGLVTVGPTVAGAKGLTASNIINAGTGIIATSGTLGTTTTAGLANFGTVFANGGAVNGLIYNTGLTGQFDVYGAVTSNAAFSNGSDAALNVAPAGKYDIANALNNAGTVGNRGVLTAGNIVNTGILTTSGTLGSTTEAGLTNSGIVFANGGAINGLVYNTGRGQFDVYGAVMGDRAFANDSGAALNVATGAAYSIAGGALNNTGLVTLAGNGALKVDNIVNTGTLVTAGTLSTTTTAGLTNAGTVFANGGTINGPIYNVGPGQFDVFGVVTDDSFSNGAGASLNVASAASYTIADTLNNAGTVTVASKGAFTAGNIVNAGGGVITTAGTLTATGPAGLTNFGTVYAVGDAVNPAVVSGLIYNTGATGLFKVFGTANSDADFANGANASLSLAPSAVFTVGGSLNNSGTVFLADGGGQTGVSTLTVNGNYVASGAATLAVGIDLRQGQQSAGQLHVMGSVSGTTLVDFGQSLSDNVPTLTPGVRTFVGGGLIEPTDMKNQKLLTVVDIDGGGSDKNSFVATNTKVLNGRNVFATNGGLVQYVLQENPNTPGEFEIASGVNTAGVTPVATAISTTLGAITTNFFQSSSAFVVPAGGNGPDQTTFGPWIRVSGGETTIDSTGTENLLRTTAQSKVDTTFEGFQAGFDTGLINVRGSDTNVHFGITTGIVGADSAEQLVANQNQPTKVSFSIPFLGVYGALKHDAFSADVTYRHDFGDLTVNTIIAGPTPTHISATGDSVYGNLLYAVGAGGFSILPSIGLGYSHYDVGNLSVNSGNSGGNSGSTLSFNNIDSLLGRLGVQVGRSVPINDKLVVQPFITGAVWHEFEGNTIARFTDGSGLFDQVSTTRVGTFGQVGVGMTAQILPVGFTGFVRGDFRFGDKLNGETGTLGVRYSF